MGRRLPYVVAPALLALILALAVAHNYWGATGMTNDRANVIATGDISSNSHATVWELLPKDAHLSLLGMRGPTLSYPVAEVYGSNSSLFVSTFLWNMQSSNGYVNMTFEGRKLVVNVDLTGFVKVQKDIPVDGYPGLMYGYENWFPFYGSTQMLPWLKLPMKLSEVPDFWSRVNYSLYRVTGSVQDFSYDVWLTQNPNVSYLQYPCIEVMVWMYHEEQLNPQYFVKVGELVVPATVNGTRLNVTFDVYVLPHTGSSNGWVGVYYVPTVQLLGKVSLPLGYMVKESVFFAQKIFPSLNASSYYLNAIQLGMEFNDDGGRANLGYVLYDWAFVT